MAENKKYYWLKLKENFFTQPRMKKLRRIAGGDTYTIIYLKLQLLSLKNEGVILFEGIEDDFIEELSLTIDEEPDNVRFTVMFLINQGLMEEINKDKYALLEAMQNMGSETAGAERVRRHREKQKALQCNTPVTIGNTEIEKEKREKIKDKRDNSENSSSDEPEISKPPTKAEIDAFFESVWDIYPNKKGKGSISDAKKKVLYSIGLPELQRAIERYRAELKKEEWRKPQYGSTFFNSGYVDYLDSNYVPSTTADTNTVQKTNQSDYDRFMAELQEEYKEGE